MTTTQQHDSPGVLRHHKPLGSAISYSMRTLDVALADVTGDIRVCWRTISDFLRAVERDAEAHPSTNPALEQHKPLPADVRQSVAMLDFVMTCAPDDVQRYWKTISGFLHAVDNAGLATAVVTP